MTEPGTQAAAKDAESKRGMPYYDKLRQDLRDSLAKKRILDRNIAAIEESVYRLEGAYLEETSAAGNIIKGFDNYIKGSSSTTSAASRRKGGISEQDRVFSHSSASFTREPSPPSSQTTPAATPTSGFASGSMNGGTGIKRKNKKSDRADDDDSDVKQNKRLKITYSRE
ncbi:MAG: hypothetical protein M1834_007230 [Cirrosporium novae-zelandiae]|nr:MAG: hypothetical protein M1834_007230 [Cirrosporium novae-zelandiae]